MASFTTTLTEVEALLKKSKLVAKGDSFSEAGIEAKWMTAYAEISRRNRDERECAVHRYPYEQGPAMNAFTGGFFKHPGWQVRRNMEKHASMRAICEYEANYINAAGFWKSFHQTAMNLRQEALEAGMLEKALCYDVWGVVSIRYGLLGVGMRVAFYEKSAEDPHLAKLLMPAIEAKGKMAAADDLQDVLEKFDRQMSTRLIKAVATLNASNAVKRTGGDGAAPSQ